MRSHFSPIFTNKGWADDAAYTSYRVVYGKKVVTEPKGRDQWGRKPGLYPKKVEHALGKDLETPAAKIYERLCQFQELDFDERLLWAQFLLSQLSRTPTFLHYERIVCKLQGIMAKPECDRVGCRECGDLACITSREWRYLVAHEDDYFVRSDNPVLLTGFVERRESCLFYPLSPQICFVACAMPEGWKPEHPHPEQLPQTLGYALEKGDAWFLNFHFARAAGESLILSPKHDGEIAQSMFTEILGAYPQPPFALHTPQPSEMDEAFESLRIIMSGVDKRDYPKWHGHELEAYRLGQAV